MVSPEFNFKEKLSLETLARRSPLRQKKDEVAVPLDANSGRKNSGWNRATRILSLLNRYNRVFFGRPADAYERFENLPGVGH
jgi:hypothetical protein